MDRNLTFISDGVIARVENGSFVPTRRSQKTDAIKDRRNVVSPLAVAKRCVRYDPHVFEHRRDLVLQMAYGLNNPEKKIMLVGGPQGCGKTSLVRGLIELMGGQDEQLLWFDVTRHTDFEEIIHYLIQYVTYICSAFGREVPESDAHSAFLRDRLEWRSVAGSEPIRRLEQLVENVSHMPLLIVLDNVEYIVDSELRFNSYPFKEMLNFLLAFPNIKMILVGERLPYADMSPNQGGVMDLKLAGLSEEDTRSLLLGRVQRDNPDQPVGLAMQEAIHNLYRKSHGHPWLLKTMLYLYHQTPLDFEALNQLLDDDAPSRSVLVSALIRYIYERLSEPQRRLFQILCLIRHPVDVRTLQTLVGVCYPMLGVMQTDADTIENILEHSLIRPLLKISYPPQEVLESIRLREKNPEAVVNRKIKPWYELYHQVKRVLYTGLPPEEKERLHGVLQDFYLKEKGVDFDDRVVRIKNKALIAEAKFHSSAARARKPVKAEPAFEGGPDTPEDWSQAASSKAYLYQQGPPLERRGPYSLDDYRRIQIPETSLPVEDDVELDLSKPLGPVELPDLPDMGEEKISFQDYLAGVQLTDEEKRLLEPPTVIPVEHPAAESQTPPSSPAEPPSSAPPADLHSVYAGLDEGDEQERLIQKRLLKAVEAHDRLGLASELLELAKYRAAVGRYESASRCLEKAISLQPESDRELMAELYRLSGTVNKETYRHNAALSALNKAAHQIQRLMYQDETVSSVWMGRLGQVYQHLGEIHAYRSHFEDALEAYNQALRWYASADDEIRQAEVYFELATVYEDMHDAENAVIYYNKALIKDEESGNLISAAAALANIGNLYFEAGRLDEALVYLHRSLTYDRQAHNMEGQLNTLDALAVIYMRQENWDQAETTCKQGLSLALHEDVGMWKAAFYAKLAQIYEARQDWIPAINHYQWALSTGQKELSQESLTWIEEKINEVRRMLSD